MIYLKALFGSHVLLIGLLIVVAVVEVLSNRFLLVNWFFYPKDLSSASGTADRESLLYFLYQFGFILYHQIFQDHYLQVNLWIWGIIVFLLSIVVRLVYMKFQGIDPDKEVLTYEEVKDRWKNRHH